jgi:hypothetical protein
MGPLIDPNPRGNIWVYNPTTTSFQVLRLDNFPEDAYFHPLGMDVYTHPKTGESTLIIINHSKSFTTLERFMLSLDTSGQVLANHVDTFSHHWLRSPNAITMINSNSFYVTNDHFLTRRLPWPFGKILPISETIMAFPGGYVNLVVLPPPSPPSTSEPPKFADKHRVLPQLSISALFIPFANGIALSPSGKEIAVASSSTASVFLYTRDAETNELKYKEKLEVPFGPDNLHYVHHVSGHHKLEQEELIVAGHAHLPTLSKVAYGNQELRPPSWVVSFTRRSSARTLSEKLDEVDIPHGFHPISAKGRAGLPTTHNAKTVFASDGSFFDGSTVGVVDLSEEGRTTYITGLYADGLLSCKEI